MLLYVSPIECIQVFRISVLATIKKIITMAIISISASTRFKIICVTIEGKEVLGDGEEGGGGGGIFLLCEARARA
jgi:hypothetical protein